MKGKDGTQGDENCSESSHRQAKGKLLLVDENTEELQYYSSILERQGYDVRPLASYRDAALRIEEESFDLLVMRQSEGNFEGRSILARTIEKNRNVPVLILSRWFESDNSPNGEGMETRENSEYSLVPSEVTEQVEACLRLASHAA